MSACVPPAGTEPLLALSEAQGLGLPVAPVMFSTAVACQFTATLLPLLSRATVCGAGLEF